MREALNTPTLSELETMARQAGEILREGFGGRMKVEYKSLIDPVTEMDHRSEALLLHEIQTRFAGHTIITEESGVLDGKDGYAWYIDPLDGTVNYAHGIPIFSVSLAYAEAGCQRLGVVYDPMRDECFKAEAGVGAWLNDEPIRVSKTLDLDRSLLVTGFPYDIRLTPANNLDHYAYLSLRSQGVRRLGSAALDICYVAAGRFDGYWELSIFPWDMAAGAIIASQAGAKITNLAGEADYLTPPQSVVAANPHLHALMMQALHRD